MNIVDVGTVSAMMLDMASCYRYDNDMKIDLGNIPYFVQQKTMPPETNLRLKQL